MKTILRNLFYTLKRFQTASVLNLMGLSAAFAAFVLLMMKVSYERDFDTCYPHTDRLVMLNLCLAWNVLYLAMNGEAMEEPEKRLLKKDIRKYFWKIFAKPYLYNWKESVKLAVKCVMVLMNDKSLGKRYV